MNKVEWNWYAVIAGVVLAWTIGFIAYANSAGEVVYDEEGYTYVVPEKRKLVEVPWWWNVKHIQYHMKGAKEIIYLDKPVVYGDADGICPPPPPPELCVSPCVVPKDPDC